ncbi:hypothetical protein VNO78_16571 [Psophocarpus tetragonolobus]|uniref:Uncharacterized protein n=1 Tax=Psophocarpus tetragonolobus TaxID=3891 RepID=A0AAN9SFW6_PSOTE
MAIPDPLALRQIHSHSHERVFLNLLPQTSDCSSILQFSTGMEHANLHYNGAIDVVVFLVVDKPRKFYRW